MSSVFRPQIEALEDRTLFAVPGDFVQELYVGGLNRPMSFTPAPDGRIFVTEQAGTIRIVKDDQLLATPFATLTVNSGHAETGLLGLTLDPDFEQNHYVYVMYTASTPTLHSRVSRLVADGDQVVPGSETILLELDTVSQLSAHNGGALRFGDDGKLYIATGDQVLYNVSQQLNSTHGKILRINADGSIPVDNPYYLQTTGVHRAIWALGLRNPFSMTVHPLTGELYINDVGHVGDDAWEEVNIGVAGGNYGWPGIQGPRTSNEPAPSNYLDPYYSYRHGVNNVNGRAITGGVFYYPPASATRAFPVEYHGDYFFLDLDAYIKTLEPDGTTVKDFATGFYTGVGVDVAPDGSLLYLQRGHVLVSPPGLFRIRYAGQPAPPSIATQPTAQRVSVGETATFSVSASGPGPVSYQWLRDGQEIQGANGATYSLDSPTLADNGAVFSVRVSNPHGPTVSDNAILTVETNKPPVPVIDLPADGSSFVAGQAVSFSGSATDPDEGTLAATSLDWTVTYFTAGVERPSVANVSGQAGGSFVPDSVTPYPAPDVKYRIYLTATDAAGRSATVYRDVLPTVSTIQLSSNLPGNALYLDGQPHETPYFESTVAGLRREISAPLTQEYQGLMYDFVGWSDGGAATHNVDVPTTDHAWTAQYQLQPYTTIAKVNFQPAGAATVGGYLVDTGETFASRNGQQYGWTVSHTDAVLDRDVNADQVLDTRVAVKAGVKWEMALPNGTYVVKVGIGDAGDASVNNVWLEDVWHYVYVGLGPNEFRQYAATVTVTDGRLTLAPGGSASGDTRLTHLEVLQAVTSPPTSPPPTSPHRLRRRRHPHRRHRPAP